MKNNYLLFILLSFNVGLSLEGSDLIRRFTIRKTAQTPEVQQVRLTFKTYTIIDPQDYSTIQKWDTEYMQRLKAKILSIVLQRKRLPAFNDWGKTVLNFIPVKPNNIVLFTNLQYNLTSPICTTVTLIPPIKSLAYCIYEGENPVKYNEIDIYYRDLPENRLMLQGELLRNKEGNEVPPSRIIALKPIK